MPQSDAPVTIAPRKPNWDLKRDVEKKLAKLERLTTRAIGEILREKASSGGSSDAAAAAAPRSASSAAAASASAADPGRPAQGSGAARNAQRAEGGDEAGTGDDYAGGLDPAALARTVSGYERGGGIAEELDED